MNQNPKRQTTTEPTKGKEKIKLRSCGCPSSTSRQKHQLQNAPDSSYLQHFYKLCIVFYTSTFLPTKYPISLSRRRKYYHDFVRVRGPRARPQLCTATTITRPVATGNVWRCRVAERARGAPTRCRRSGRGLGPSGVTPKGSGPRRVALPGNLSREKLCLWQLNVCTYDSRRDASENTVTERERQ